MTSAIKITVLFALATAALQAQPIRLHPENPHYFLFHGKAVALITNGEHYGSVINADFDYHRYLATLAAEGMNYTRIFGGSYREAPGRSFGILRNTLAPAPGRYIAPWAASGTPGYAGGGNKFNLHQWNAEFFERYREFLAEAEKRNIVVEITLFSSHYGEGQWNLSPFNTANNVNGTAEIDWKKLHTLENENVLAVQERYTRKLVREANGFDNVIFEIQNEPWSDRPTLTDAVNPYLPPPGRDLYPNSVEVADGLANAWETKGAEWISSEEATLPKKHLIAQNYTNFRLAVGTLAPGVSIVNFHYAYPEAVLWNFGLGKAIAYDETGFLGQGDDGYRRQAWRFMMSGGSIFDGLDYSFTPGREDGTDTERNGPGGGSPELRRQLRILSELLQKLPLVNLAPDLTVVKSSNGSYARALSSAGREYGMYFEGCGGAVLELPAGSYSGEWVDTKTGSVHKLRAFRHAGGEKTMQAPECRSEIALHLKRNGG